MPIIMVNAWSIDVRVFIFDSLGCFPGKTTKRLQIFPSAMSRSAAQSPDAEGANTGSQAKDVFRLPSSL